MLDNYRDLIDELLGTPTSLRQLAATRPGTPLPAAVARLVAELRDRDRAVLQRLQPEGYGTSRHGESSKDKGIEGRAPGAAKHTYQ